MIHSSPVERAASLSKKKGSLRQPAMMRRSSGNLATLAANPPRKDDTHRRTDWPEDLSEVVYIDHFGNAMTGLRALTVPRDAKLVAMNRVLEPARTFSDRPPGTAFWYENSNGLVEIAVNQGRADRELGLTVGMPIEIVP